MRGSQWSTVIATRPDIENPVMNSSQTLSTCFALCVPVISANECFNTRASCRLRSSVAYAYEAAECARVVPQARSPRRRETLGMLQDFWRYCIEGLAADGCLDPGSKSSRMNIWGKCLAVSDDVDICAYQ